MEIQKHLTIKEALNERDKIENELILTLKKKKINYEKTQPSAVNIKDIVVSSSRITFDNFMQYMIRDEELDLRIYALYESMNSYNEYIIRELKRISQISPYKLKVFEMREDNDFIKKYGRKRTFIEIGDKLGYSERQVQRIYDEITKGKI